MSQAVAASRPSAQRGDERPAEGRRAIAVGAFLVLAVLSVFGRTLGQGFLNYDDPFFVWDQPHVSEGLSWSGIAWACTDGPDGEWYPVSMLSHMLDCQLYGLNPAWHHLSNVLLHAATSVVLFLVLWRMTAELWPSALVAALFALHPLRVESVAWIAERRDVLSGLFFMLTLAAYGEYVRRPRSVGRYLAIVGFFALGLMSKSILVTVPPLLLLLDFWPLRRIGWGQPGSAAAGLGPAPFPWRVVWEKLPLLAMTLAAAVVTMLTHSPLPTQLSLAERSANAAVSCVAYMVQLIIPVGLSFFYPYPEAGRPVWQVAGALVLLLAITVAAIAARRSYPYFFVGWFWYVGMLIPVLGLTSIGPSARADRYTYLPQIGLGIALVWGVIRLGAASPARRWIFGIGSALLLAALMASTWRQLGFWQDEKTLWEHALACDPKNPKAHRYLGELLERTDEVTAAQQFRQALELGPNERNIYAIVRATAHDHLGGIAVRKGDTGDAIAHYQESLDLNPSAVATHMKLGYLLAENGDWDEAMLHFQRSLELDAKNATTYNNIALVLAQHGKTDQAIATFREGLRVDPGSYAVLSNLATLLAGRGELDEAIGYVRRAIAASPRVASLCHQMAQLLREQGKTSEAVKYEERGKKVGRRQAEAQTRRGIELVQIGRTNEAIAQFQAALSAAGDYAPAHFQLAEALAKQGNNAAAIEQYRQAIAIDPDFAAARQSLQRLLNP
jgi:protein O-mannosyl-transferase